MLISIDSLYLKQIWHSKFYKVDCDRIEKLTGVGKGDEDIVMQKERDSGRKNDRTILREIIQNKENNSLLVGYL